MRNHPAAVVAPPAAAVALLVWAVGWAVGVSPAVAAVVAAAVGLAAAGLLWSSAPQSALAAVGARPLGRGEHPRLENLVEGLCTTHGFPPPSVYVVETPAVNAASAGRRRPPAHLILTRGALSGLDRLELEAVVARQLCEIRRGVAVATVQAGVARIPWAGTLAARMAGRTSAPDRVAEVDLESVRLTSYPPALASALSKAAIGPSVGASAAAAHLWFVTPRGTGSAARAEPSTEQRIAVLGEI